MPTDSIDSRVTLEWAPGGGGLLNTPREGLLLTARLDLGGPSPRIVGRDTLRTVPGNLWGAAPGGRVLFRGTSPDALATEERTQVRVVTDLRQRLRRLAPR